MKKEEKIFSHIKELLFRLLFFLLSCLWTFLLFYTISVGGLLTDLCLFFDLDNNLLYSDVEDLKIIQKEQDFGLQSLFSLLARPLIPLSDLLYEIDLLEKEEILLESTQLFEIKQLIKPIQGIPKEKMGLLNEINYLNEKDIVDIYAFVFTNPQEVLYVAFKLSITLTLVFNLPYFIYLIYGFIIPGLYKTEAKNFKNNIYIHFTLALAVLYCIRNAIPYILKTLMIGDFKFLPKISESLNFYLHLYGSLFIFYLLFLIWMSALIKQVNTDLKKKKAEYIKKNLRNEDTYFQTLLHTVDHKQSSLQILNQEEQENPQKIYKSNLNSYLHANEDPFNNQTETNEESKEINYTVPFNEWGKRPENLEKGKYVALIIVASFLLLPDLIIQLVIGGFSILALEAGEAWVLWKIMSIEKKAHLDLNLNLNKKK